MPDDHQKALEAAARALHNKRIEGLQNCYDWDTSGLDDEHPGYRDSVYRDAHAAVQAYLRARAEGENHGEAGGAGAD